MRLWAPADTLREATPDRAGTHLARVGAAAALTIAYSDLFDYAPSVAEVQRYLLGVVASPAEVRLALAGGHAGPAVELWGELCCLSGRRHLLAVRRERRQAARRLRRTARPYLVAVQASPFARMVGLSGSLAAHNADADADVDLFVVAAPGRLWLCRGFLVALARLGARAGLRLCPNFLVSSRRLELPDHNLFVANELFRLIPISGHDVYRALLARNEWARAFLPNARPWPVASPRSVVVGLARRALEAPLAGAAGGWLDRWEMRRKVARLTARAANGTGGVVELGPDVCRGHFAGHERRVLERFARASRALGVDWPGSALGGAAPGG